MNVFTPRIAEDAEGEFGGFRIWDRSSGGDVRLAIKLTEESRTRWDQHSGDKSLWENGGSVELTDAESGIVFLARPAPCGLGCFCAAEVVEVVSNPVAAANDAAVSLKMAQKKQALAARRAAVDSPTDVFRGFFGGQV